MKKNIKKIQLKKTTVSLLNGMSAMNAIGGMAPTQYTVCQTNKNCNTLEFICISVNYCPEKQQPNKG